MELRVNKDTVTHIRLYPERKGVQEIYWGNESYKLLPAKKEFWWWGCFFGWNRYPKGYYRNSKYSIDTLMGSGYTHFTEEEVEDLDGVFIKDDELHTKSIIKIYYGKYLIREKFFDTEKRARDYCDAKFPNVNVVFKS